MLSDYEGEETRLSVRSMWALLLNFFLYGNETNGRPSQTDWHDLPLGSSICSSRKIKAHNFIITLRETSVCSAALCGCPGTRGSAAC